MLTSPTTSPYLSALQRAAVASRPSKQDHPSDGDFCFVCGNTTPAAVAYCSDACRAQDEHPSPLLSPTATALPALVPSHSRRRTKKSQGQECSPLSSASSPLRTAEGEDDDEEDIENLVLPPPVGSYGKKAPFNYAYTLATSPVAARSPVKSPVVRPSQAPAQPYKSPRALLPSTIQPSSPSANPETITFRRRHQPDSINGAKAAASALSPALLARRRLSNQQLLQQQHTASAAASMSRASSQSSSSAKAAANQTKRSSIPRRSPNFDLDLSLPSTSHRLCGSSHPGKVAGLSGLPPTSRCVHVGCPVSHAAQIASGYPALQRRVSEPHSPYASPRAVSPAEQNTFDRSFTARRPSLSTSATAPPLISKSETKSQDYTGFAGFLAKVYREKGEVNQDGYEGQDEEHRESFRRALKKKNSSSSREGLYMLSGRKAPKSPKVKPVESVKTAQGSSSSDSSAAPRESSRPGRFLFSRGQASGAKASPAPATPSSEDDHEEIPHRVASAERPRHNHSASIGESSRYIVSVRPEQSGRERPEQASNTALATSSSSSSDEGRDFGERPENRGPTAQPTLKRTPSQVREQHSSRVEAQQERGRTSGRRPSTSHRAPVVSPFTALRNVTNAQPVNVESDKPVAHRQVSSPGESGRGRSRARIGTAYLQRSVSPNRSSSRASRSPRRDVAT